MILCVNLNAAIDKTVVVPGFRLGAIHRPTQVIAAPGGKGVNVARALRTLGETPTVTGWTGGFAGQFIADGLRREGIATAFVTVEAESRTCLSILDPDSGALTEVYERGEPLPPAQVAEFRTLFQAIVGRYAAVTLSGSLPPGVPIDFYGDLLRLADAAGVPAALDTSGDALVHALAAGRPWFIKPNRAEFEALVGQPLASLADLARAARAASHQYGTTVVLSLGAVGALAARGDETVHVRPPALPIQSAVGSGDALVAGMVVGLRRGGSLADALAWGVAAGTANALTLGAGQLTREDFERVYRAVRCSVL